MIKFFSELVRNNTGVSSKSFFLVCVTITGIILLSMPIFALLVDIIYNHTVTTDLNGLAAYVASVAAIFTSAGITKAWGDMVEKKNDRKTDLSEHGDKA